MKKSFLEEIILLLSVLKWAFLSTIVGAVVGISTTVFLKCLDFATNLFQLNKHYYWGLPFVLFVSSLIIQVFAPDAQGNGTDKVIEAVHKRWGKIKLSVVPVKMVATLLTLAGGASAGKEGPCVQIGAGLASGVADIFRLNQEDRRKIVICGISAGFSTIFGTPIAGALFAVEVLVLGKILQEVLFSSLIAGVVGYQVSTLLGITYLHQAITLKSQFSQGLLLKILLSGIFFGFIAILLIETLKFCQRISRKIKVSMPYKGLIGGAVLIALTLMTSPHYLGLGTSQIEMALKGQEISTFSFFWKIIFTGVTLSMGGSGGIQTPIFFIGTSAGNLFAHILNLDASMFAAIGMVAMLAGAANTPIAACVMSLEMFGSSISSLAAIACLVSYIISGHRSAYPTQMIAQSKSHSIDISYMEDFSKKSDITILNRPGKLAYILRPIYHKIKKGLKFSKKKMGGM